MADEKNEIPFGFPSRVNLSAGVGRSIAPSAPGILDSRGESDTSPGSPISSYFGTGNTFPWVPSAIASYGEDLPPGAQVTPRIGPGTGYQHSAGLDTRNQLNYGSYVTEATYGGQPMYGNTGRSQSAQFGPPRLGFETKEYENGVRTVDIGGTRRGGYSADGGGYKPQPGYVDPLSSLNAARASGQINTDTYTQMKAKLNLNAAAPLYSGVRTPWKDNKRMLQPPVSTGVGERTPAVDAFPVKNAYIPDDADLAQYYTEIQSGLKKDAANRQTHTTFNVQMDRSVASAYGKTPTYQGPATPRAQPVKNTPYQVPGRDREDVKPLFLQAGIAMARNWVASVGSRQRWSPGGKDAEGNTEWSTPGAAVSTMAAITAAQSFGSRYGVQQEDYAGGIRHLSTALTESNTPHQMVLRGINAGVFDHVEPEVFHTNGVVDTEKVNQYVVSAQKRDPDTYQHKLAEYMTLRGLQTGNYPQLHPDLEAGMSAQAKFGPIVRQIESARATSAVGAALPHENPAPNNDDETATRGDHAEDVADRETPFQTGMHVSSFSDAENPQTRMYQETRLQVQESLNVLHEGLAARAGGAQVNDFMKTQVSYDPENQVATRTRTAIDGTVQRSMVRSSVALSGGQIAGPQEGRGLSQRVLDEDHGNRHDLFIASTMQGSTRAPNARALSRMAKEQDALALSAGGQGRGYSMADIRHLSSTMGRYRKEHADRLANASASGDISDYEAFDYNRDQNADPSTALSALGSEYTMTEAFSTMGGFQPDPLGLMARQMGKTNSTLQATSSIPLDRKESMLLSNGRRDEQVDLSEIAEMLVAGRNVTYNHAPDRKDASGDVLEHLYRYGQSLPEILEMNQSDAPVFPGQASAGFDMNTLTRAEMDSRAAQPATDDEWNATRGRYADDLKRSVVARGVIDNKGTRGPLPFTRENIRPDVMAEHGPLMEQLLSGETPELPTKMTERKGRDFDDIVYEGLKSRARVFNQYKGSPVENHPNSSLASVYGVEDPALARALHAAATSEQGSLRGALMHGLKSELAPGGTVAKPYRDISRAPAKVLQSDAVDQVTPQNERWMQQAKELATVTAARGDTMLGPSSAAPRPFRSGALKAANQGMLKTLGLDNFMLKQALPQDMHGVVDQLGAAGTARYLEGRQVLSATTRTGDLRGYRAFLNANGNGLNIKKSFDNSRDFEDWMRGTAMSRAYVRGVGDPDGRMADRTRNSRAFLNRVSMIADTGNINNSKLSEEMQTPALSSFKGFSDANVRGAKVSIKDTVAEAENRVARLNSARAQALQNRKVAAERGLDLKKNYGDRLQAIGLDPFKATPKQQKQVRSTLDSLAKSMGARQYEASPHVATMRAAVGYWDATRAARNTEDALMAPVSAADIDANGKVINRQRRRLSDTEHQAMIADITARDITPGRRVLDALNSDEQKGSLAEFLHAGTSLLAQRNRGVPIEYREDKSVYSTSRIREDFMESLKGGTAQDATARLHGLIALHDEFRANTDREGTPAINEDMTRRLAKVMGAKTTFLGQSFGAAAARDNGDNNFIYGNTDGRESHADQVASVVRQGLAMPKPDRRPMPEHMPAEAAARMYSDGPGAIFANSPEQMAVMRADPRKLTVVNSGPGTTKSTSVRSYLTQLAADQGASEARGEGTPFNIVAASFSVPGRRELEEGLNEQLNTEDRDRILTTTLDADSRRIYVGEMPLVQSARGPRTAADNFRISGQDREAITGISAHHWADTWQTVEQNDKEGNPQQVAKATIDILKTKKQQLPYMDRAMEVVNARIAGAQPGDMFHGAEKVSSQDMLERVTDLVEQGYIGNQYRKALGPDASPDDHATALAMQGMHTYYAQAGAVDYDYMKVYAKQALQRDAQTRQIFDPENTVGALDESQDMRKTDRDFALARFQGGLLAVGDSGQNLGIDPRYRNTVLNAGDELKAGWHGEIAEDLALTHSRRQGASAIAAANAILGTNNTGDQTPGREGQLTYTGYNHTGGLVGEVSGQVGLLKSMMDEDPEMMTEMVNGKMKPRKISMVSPTNEGVKSIQNELKRQGIPYMDGDGRDEEGEEVDPMGRVIVDTIHGVKGQTHDVLFGIGFGQGELNLTRPNAEVPTPEQIGSYIKGNDAPAGMRGILQKAFMSLVGVTRANTTILSGSGAPSQLIKPAIQALQNMDPLTQVRDNYTLNEAIPSSRGADVTDPAMVAEITKDRVFMAGQTNRDSALTTDMPRLIPQGMELAKGAEAFMSERARQTLAPPTEAMQEFAKLAKDRQPLDLPKVSMSWDAFHKTMAGDKTTLNNPELLGQIDAQGNPTPNAFEIHVNDNKYMGGPQNMPTGVAIQFGQGEGEGGWQAKQNGLDPYAGKSYQQAFSLLHESDASRGVAFGPSPEGGEMPEKTFADFGKMQQREPNFIKRDGTLVDDRYMFSGSMGDQGNPWRKAIEQQHKTQNLVANRQTLFERREKIGAVQVVSDPERYAAMLKRGAQGIDLTGEEWANPNVSAEEAEKRGLSTAHLAASAIGSSIGQGHAGDFFKRVGSVLGRNQNLAVLAPNADSEAVLQTSFSSMGMTRGDPSKVVNNQLLAQRSNKTTLARELSGQPTAHLNSGMLGDDGIGQRRITDKDYVLSFASPQNGKNFDRDDRTAAYKGIGKLLDSRSREAQDQGKNLRVRIGGSGMDLMAGELAMQRNLPLDIQLPAHPDDYMEMTGANKREQARLRRLLQYSIGGDGKKAQGTVSVNNIAVEREGGEISTSLSALNAGRSGMLIAQGGRKADEVATYWQGQHHGETTHQLQLATTLGVPITNLAQDPEGRTKSIPGLGADQTQVAMEAAANSRRLTSAADKRIQALADPNKELVDEQALEAKRVQRYQQQQRTRTAGARQPVNVSEQNALVRQRTNSKESAPDYESYEPVEMAGHDEGPAAALPKPVSDLPKEARQAPPELSGSAKFIRQAASMIPNADKLLTGGVHLASQDEALGEAQKRFGPDAKALRGWSDPKSGAVYVADQGDHTAGRAMMAQTVAHEAGHLAIAQARSTNAGEKSYQAALAEFGAGPQGNIPSQYTGTARANEAMADVFAQSVGARDFATDPHVYMEPEAKHQRHSINPTFALKAIDALNKPIARFKNAFSKEFNAWMPQTAALTRTPEELVSRVEGLPEANLPTKRPVGGGSGPAQYDARDFEDDLPDSLGGNFSDEAMGGAIAAVQRKQRTARGAQPFAARGGFEGPSQQEINQAHAHAQEFGQHGPQPAAEPHEEFGAPPESEGLGGYGYGAHDIPEEAQERIKEEGIFSGRVVMGMGDFGNFIDAANQSKNVTAFHGLAEMKNNELNVSRFSSRGSMSMLEASRNRYDNTRYMFGTAGANTNADSEAESLAVGIPGEEHAKEGVGIHYDPARGNIGVSYGGVPAQLVVQHGDKQLSAVEAMHMRAAPVPGAATQRPGDVPKSAVGGNRFTKIFQSFFGLGTKQQQAVMDEPAESRMGVLADAGTGKTFSILGRTANLLRKGMRPSEMAYIAYNRVTAKDFEGKMKGAFPDEGMYAGMKIMTANALSKEITKVSDPGFLKTVFGRDFDPKKMQTLSSAVYQRAIDPDTGKPAEMIAGDQGHHPGDDVMLMHDTMAKEWGNLPEEARRGIYSQSMHDYKYGQYANEMESVKVARYMVGQNNKMLQGGRFAQEQANEYQRLAGEGEDITPMQTGMAQMALAYQKAQGAAGKLGHEETTLAAWQSLQKPANSPQNNPGIAEIQEHFGHTLLDETPDLSEVQLATVNHLSAGRGMTAVGDTKQRIYGFRGAAKDFVSSLGLGGNIKRLQTSQRNQQSILDTVNAAFDTETVPTEQNKGRGRVSFDHTKMFGEAGWKAENQRMADDLIRDLQTKGGQRYLDPNNAHEVLMTVPTHDRRRHLAEILENPLKQLGLKTKIARSPEQLDQDALSRVGMKEIPDPTDDPDAHSTFTDERNKVEAEYKAQKGIGLSIHHQTKGLEADWVYGGGMTGEGSGQILTSQLTKRLGPAGDENLDAGIQDEKQEAKNVAYVVATRAKQMLRMYGSGEKSRFFSRAASVLGLDRSARNIAEGEAAPPAVAGSSSSVSSPRNPISVNTPRTVTQQVQAVNGAMNPAQLPADALVDTSKSLSASGQSVGSHPAQAAADVVKGTALTSGKAGNSGAVEVAQPGAQGHGAIDVRVTNPGEISEQMMRALPAAVQKLLELPKEGVHEYFNQQGAGAGVATAGAIGQAAAAGAITPEVQHALSERIPGLADAARANGSIANVIPGLNAANYDVANGGFRAPRQAGGASGGGGGGIRQGIDVGPGGMDGDEPTKGFRSRNPSAGTIMRGVLNTLDHFGKGEMSLYEHNLKTGSEYDFLASRAALATGQSRGQVDATAIQYGGGALNQSAGIRGISQIDMAQVQRYVTDPKEAGQLAMFAKMGGIDMGTAARDTRQLGKQFNLSAGNVANIVSGARNTGGTLDEGELLQAAQATAPFAYRADGTPGDKRLVGVLAMSQALGDAGIDVDRGTRQLYQHMAMPDVVMATRLKQAHDYNMQKADPNVSRQEMDQTFTSETYWNDQAQIAQLHNQTVTSPLRLREMRSQMGVDGNGRSLFQPTPGGGSYAQQLMQAPLGQLSNQALDVRQMTLNITAERQNLTRQGTILDIQERMQTRQVRQEQMGLNVQGMQIAFGRENLAIKREQFGLQKEENKLDLQGTRLDVSNMQIRAKYAQENSDLSYEKSGIEYRARTRDLELEKRMLPAKAKQMEVSIASQEASFQFQKEGIEFQRYYDTQMYGTPGGDRSYRAYTAMERGQTEMAHNGGYGSDQAYNKMNQQAAAAPVMGLANEQFYAGIQHQLSQLQFGRSAFRSEAGYNENVKYIQKQTDMYERRMALEDKAREFSYRQQDKQLELAKANWEVQKELLKYQKEQLQNQIEDAARLIPIEERLNDINHEIEQAEIKQMPERIAIELAKLGLKEKGTALSEKATEVSLRQEDAMLKAQGAQLAEAQASLEDQKKLNTQLNEQRRAELKNASDNLAIREEQLKREQDLAQTKQVQLEEEYKMTARLAEINASLEISHNAIKDKGIGTENGRVLDFTEFAKTIAEMIKSGKLDPHVAERMTQSWTDPAMVQAVRSALDGTLDNYEKQILAKSDTEMSRQPGQQSEIDKAYTQIAGQGGFDYAEWQKVMADQQIAMKHATDSTNDLVTAMEKLKGAFGTATGDFHGVAGQIGSMAGAVLDVVNLATGLKLLSKLGPGAGGAAGLAGTVAEGGALAGAAGIATVAATVVGLIAGGVGLALILDETWKYFSGKKLSEQIGDAVIGKDANGNVAYDGSGAGAAALTEYNKTNALSPLALNQLKSQMEEYDRFAQDPSKWNSTASDSQKMDMDAFQQDHADLVKLYEQSGGASQQQINDAMRSGGGSEDRRDRALQESYNNSDHGSEHGRDALLAQQLKTNSDALTEDKSQTKILADQRHAMQDQAIDLMGVNKYLQAHGIALSTIAKSTTETNGLQRTHTKDLEGIAKYSSITANGQDKIVLAVQTQGGSLKNIDKITSVHLHKLDRLDELLIGQDKQTTAFKDGLKDLVKAMIKDAGQRLAGGAGSLSNTTTTGTPKYDIGIKRVEQDQFAKLHKGEAVLTPNEAAAFRAGLDEVSGLPGQMKDVVATVMKASVGNVMPGPNDTVAAPSEMHDTPRTASGTGPNLDKGKGDTYHIEITQHVSGDVPQGTIDKIRESTMDAITEVLEKILKR